MAENQRRQREIKILLWVLVSGLFISGLTAFPIHTELTLAQNAITFINTSNAFTDWMERVFTAVNEIDTKYPFIAYGTDWLAFAHIVLAILFAGVIRDPVKNIWVIQFGLIACAGIVPLALIAGNVRGIPFFWQLIDCSFGLFGGLVLWLCYRRVKACETESAI